MSDQKILLVSRKRAIQDKVMYLKSIIKSGIDHVEIFTRGTDQEETAYLNRHDIPFNLTREISILLFDSIEYYEDMIIEIEYQLDNL